MSQTEWERAVAFLDVTDPLVAWHVYRGEMVSAPHVHQNALSFWTTKYLAGLTGPRARAGQLRAELALDAIRRRRHPAAVSRLAGFYVFPDEETALRAKEAWRIGLRREHLAELVLRPEARRSRFDSEWITRNLMREDVAAWADDYFAGKARAGDPIWEILVDGRALVLGTELRQAAYATVKKTWPRSLALLELARVGVELDSDLGLIGPLLRPEGDSFVIDYEMNFEDATDNAFLDRFLAFDGPKNTEDLRADSDLVLPDLSAQSISL